MAPLLADGLFVHTAKSADPVFTTTLNLDLADVVPSMAGPKRPEGRVALPAVATETSLATARLPALAGILLGGVASLSELRRR